MSNLILIGMMGCGKTTVGQLLAQRLGWAFIDTDAYIEGRLGRTIPDLFAKEGEEYFRDWELRVSRELAGRDRTVIACGGGLPTRPDAIAVLKASGRVVWLNRDPEEIIDTVSMAGRPLGQGGRQAFLDRFAQREPIYRQWADHIVQGHRSPQEAAEELAALYAEV